MWIDNLDGTIGVGYGVVTHTLFVGQHRITPSFPDGLGGEASPSVFIKVKPKE